MKRFCFTVDDNIRFLKELTEKRYKSIFDQPYLAMMLRLHVAFGLNVQLNLFYRMEDFDLSQITEAYRDEWKENADWLKFSFHSELENHRPYENAGYDEVFLDCKRVHDQVCRFASEASLAKTTTVHYCRTTKDGLRALADNGVVGLLGLFGDDKEPRTSYELSEEDAGLIRKGQILCRDGISFGSIDIVLNRFSAECILSQLEKLCGREFIRVMIHEQYFYGDYRRYQPDFEEKLRSAFGFLCENGYQSCFFEDTLS